MLLKPTARHFAVVTTVSLTASAAFSQAMTFRGIDANEDGVLSMKELKAAFGPNAELAMQHYDMNRDGVVEVDEAVKVSMHGAVARDPGEATRVEDVRPTPSPLAKPAPDETIAMTDESEEPRPGGS